MKNPIKIALVDDHELLRNGLASLINSFKNYKVIIGANNGKDFITQVNKDKTPDIILLDITMPVMDGYETALWIKSNLPTTKILVLSMMDNDNSIIRMLKNGAVGFILKDSKPAMLQTALDSIVEYGYFTNDLINAKMLHYVNSDGEESVQSFPSMHLTEREITYLKLAASEKTHNEIANELNISVRTVDGYRDSLFEKLKFKTRIGLVLFAIKNGIVSI